jgi:hypothetical protein
MLMLDQTPLTSTPTCGRNHRNGRAVWTETGGRFPPKSEGGFRRNTQLKEREQSRQRDCAVRSIVGQGKSPTPDEFGARHGERTLDAILHGLPA